MATDDDIQTFFRADQFTIRDENLHAEAVCGLQCGSTVSAHISVTYGINQKSLFEDVKFFNVTKCFPQDIMHVLFEGVLAKEILLLLTYCCNEKFFSLACLNQSISSFDYGYHEIANKSSNIESLDRVTLRASQWWCLGRHLPLIISQYIPEDDDKWACFLTLLSIMSILTSFSISPDDCALLSTLIEDHHIHFKAAYPDVHLTPKFHYLVHLPQQILRFGPPRAVWCMRFEGKNGDFKDRIGNNFKNIPFSMAYNHQLSLCHRLLHLEGQPSPPFWNPGDDIGRAKYEEIPADSLVAEKLSELSGLNPLPLHILKSSPICVHGVWYKVGCIVRLPPREFEPVFRRVTHIYILSDVKYFVVEIFVTHTFILHILHIKCPLAPLLMLFPSLV